MNKTGPQALFFPFPIRDVSAWRGEDLGEYCFEGGKGGNSGFWGGSDGFCAD
jgi:hypothetical protein